MSELALLNDFYGAPEFRLAPWSRMGNEMKQWDEMNKMMKAPSMNCDFIENDKNYELNVGMYNVHHVQNCIAMRSCLNLIYEHFCMVIDMPGFKKDDININIDNGVLTMDAHKEEEKTEEKKNYYHRERSWGKVQRSFRLPRNADHDAADVKYTDGVLKLTFPKKEVVGAKKLTVA